MTTMPNEPTVQSKGRRSKARALSAAGATAAFLAILIVGFGGVPTTEAAASPVVSSPAAATAGPSPIKHVVIILQENHSFDNVLGKFCTEVQAKTIHRGGADASCDGTSTGTLNTGQVVPLASSPNFVPTASHSVVGQQEAIDGGKMDGFNLTPGCTGSSYPTCYNQYDPLSGPCAGTTGSCIPNVGALASTYAVSDRTFEYTATPSWAGHLVFATADQDGFAGDIPSAPGTRPNQPTPVATGPGWGCDSGYSAPWGPSNILVPSCIPDITGSLGPNWIGYSGVKAPYEPTVFDRLTAKGLSWRIYGGAGSPGTGQGFTGSGWTWAICPSYAECLYSPQRTNLQPATTITTDAANGTLPSFSIVTPTVANSQHNDDLMSTGDNWIGSVMSSLQASPEWSSTAVFVTWDDCGCFSDHVNPATYSGGQPWGIRVPVIVASPYAKPGFTDSHPTTFVGMLAYAEKTFGLQALGTSDATAYDYSGAFCYKPATAGCANVGTAATAHMITTPASAMSARQKQLSAASAKDDT